MNLNDRCVSPLISVIIANWNGRSWLAQCLPTLQKQTFSNFEVIVVDNGSRDDSVNWLLAEWPTVRVIALKINLGFAAANNIGIRNARGKFIVTLNNDTLVDKNFLTHLVAAVSTSDIGMVAPKITIWNQPDKLDSTGIELDKLGTAWNRGYQQASDSSYPKDVFGPSAAAALYRKEMLMEIGLFDEQFFAYYEDVDLAWRAQRAGWKCIYVDQAHVQHWHSATGEKQPNYKAFLIGRNKIWCFIKNYPSPRIFYTLVLFLIYDGLAAVMQTIRLKSETPILGRLRGWLTIRHFWAKRTQDAIDVRMIQIIKPKQFNERIRKEQPTDIPHKPSSRI